MWNDSAAADLINSPIGEKWFCVDCEAAPNCKKDFGKVHPLSSYVYRYLIDIENGFKIYPNGRSWEHEPEWFISLLTAAQNKLREIQSDPMYIKRQQEKVKR